MVDTLEIRVRVRLDQRHELRLHALAAVEKRWAQVQHTNLSWPHVAAAQQSVHRRERHRRRVLVLAACCVLLHMQLARVQARAAMAGLQG